jgi:hypothetical protein
MVNPFEPGSRRRMGRLEEPYAPWAETTLASVELYRARCGVPADYRIS